MAESGVSGVVCSVSRAERETRHWALSTLLLLLLCTFSFAGGLQPVPGGSGTTSPSAGLKTVLDMAIALIVPAMLALVALAAAAYVIGQLFGAETQARATMWAKSMLAAVAVAAALLAVLFIFIPNYSATPSIDVDAMLAKLLAAAQGALSVLIILMVVVSAAVYALGQMSGAEMRARATVWATGMLAGALVCSVIYILVFQIFTSFQGTFFSGSPIAPYAVTIITTAFFVTVVILITYLVSRVFGIPEWEAYLSVELTNLSGSFMLFLFVVAFFGVSKAFTAMAIGSTDSAPVVALTFLRETVANNLLLGMKDIFTIQTCTSMLSTINRRIGEAALTNVIKVFPGIDAFVSITNVLGYGFVAIYGSISTQIAAMNLIDATMFSFILPAGLVLRFFPPTRDAGSFLIAFAFGFQFVFPLIYIVNGMVLKDIGAPTYDQAKSGAIISMVCQVGTYGAAGFFFNPIASNPLFKYLPGMTNVFKVIISEPTLNLLPMLFFLPVMQTLALLSLYGLFIPAFALVITIAFINAMTKFLTQKV